MMTGYDFGALRLPQNLETGQRVEDRSGILGVAPRLRNGGWDRLNPEPGYGFFGMRRPSVVEPAFGLNAGLFDMSYSNHSGL